MNTPATPATPAPSFTPDKVHVSAYYDERGRCHSVDIYLNYDGISREDLTETIRSAVHPEPMLTDGTFRHRELGSTDIIPAATRNGVRNNQAPTPINVPRSRQGQG